jgi:hypothetical protein
VLDYDVLSDCSLAYLSRYCSHLVSIILRGRSTPELRAFVEASGSPVNTGGLQRDGSRGVRTSVAILIESCGWWLERVRLELVV